MGLSELCNRSVVVTLAKTSVEDAARLMREHHVGSLVVVEESARGRHPIGIITDRDIVIEVVAARVAPATVTVGEIMGPEHVTAREGDEPWDTIALMRQRGVRRIPVDASFRMDARALAGAIVEDRAAGWEPFYVFATLGTTSTTGLDPVAAIADVCAAERLWTTCGR